ncbi:MAG: hypothetical protein LUQ07_07900 [Methanospirillum sp.]|nr:hypothetical protein [Methanospirillum sp.]
MEKRDIIVILAAIVVVLIMAVVVKPMLTGQPVIFLPESPPSPVDIQPEPGQEYVPDNVVPPESPSVTETLESSPPSGGDQETNPVSEETKPVMPEPTTMTWQPEPDNPMPAVQMTNYAEIIGKYSGASAPFRIPTPYWELHYNITPADVMPEFSMDVMELSNDEEKIIRTITWREGKEPNPQDFRFFEGGKDYYLNITANQLENYRIVVQIPLKYIRDT